MQVEVEEGQRQMIILALAELALSRPGWDWTLGETAKLFNGTAEFESGKVFSADRVFVERGPMMPYCFMHEPESEVRDWVVNIQTNTHPSGDFLHAVVDAVTRADAQNYILLRPTLLRLVKKYPKYSEPGKRKDG